MPLPLSSAPKYMCSLQHVRQSPVVLDAQTVASTVPVQEQFIASSDKPISKPFPTQQLLQASDSRLRPAHTSSSKTTSEQPHFPDAPIGPLELKPPAVQHLAQSPVSVPK